MQRCVPASAALQLAVSTQKEHHTCSAHEQRRRSFLDGVGTARATLLLMAGWLLLMAGCAEEPPVAVDGNASLVIVAMWNSTGNDSLPTFEPLAGAKVVLTSEYGTMVRATDYAGELRLDRLPAATYSISVRRSHPLDPGIQLVGSVIGLTTRSGGTTADTIFSRAVSSSGIAINEIYSAGPLNDSFFFFDQFLELYNASDSTRYLDGMLVMRVSGNSEGLGPGADEGADGDIDGVTYIFQFPGLPGGTEHALKPGQFMVLAVDAVNHKAQWASSVDLSKADWEFYNQFSPDDIDNPNVPNLINIRSDRTVDFLYGLTADVMVVADGRDTVWVDGIDISTVVDAVEYQTNPPPTSKKTLDARVDRGYALSPPRYSGQSIQRVEPGSDTNDSTIDFEIIPRATPGYQ